MSLELTFRLDEVNLSVHSLFNQVRWLQASHDLTVDLAAFRKIGVDFFSRYRERIVENKRGDSEE